MPTPSSSKRLLSLDVFRGMTIAGMVLVNSPGNETAYAPLDHAAWNGLTPTDWVFPFFVFIAGVSVVFSLTRRLEQGASRGALLGQAFRRALIIFGLGLLLNGFPHYNLALIRIPGVLQRIAICYFFGVFFFLWTNILVQIGAIAVLLSGYAWLMTHLQAPGFPIGDLTKEGNFAAYIDRTVFGAHMYRPVYDPEGILSTLPAIATGLFGNLTGYWLRGSGAQERKATGCLQAGCVFLLAGWKWGQYFPINKALWTSSYVLVTAGLALLIFGVVYAIVEIKGWRRWSKPFEVLGMNAIAVYFLHVFFLKVQNLIHVPQPDGSPGNLRFYVTQLFFGQASPVNASLLYAVGYTGLWTVFAWVLYRRKIFIKI